MTERPIGWNVQFKIEPGKTNTFRKIVEEAAADVEPGEPRTLMWQWFLSEDDEKATVHVWCSDQEAAVHLSTGVGPQKHLPRLLEISSIERFDVYGTPGNELAEIQKNFPVTSRNRHFAGFTR